MKDFLRRLFGASSRAQPPEWATFFTGRQYAAFITLVTDHLEKQGAPFTVGNGMIRIGNEGDPEYRQLGLLNLAQKCHLQAERHWGQIIANHFTTVEKSQKEEDALEERLEDFAKVSELLAVRLWPLSYRDQLDDEHLVYREDLPGVLSVLVYDLPSTIRNVSPQETEAWERTKEELFQIALANVREICIPDVITKDVGDGVSLTCLVDESYYVASHALLLEHHPDCVGVHGALIGIPHRHAMISYPINDAGVIRAINRMIPLAFGLEKEGPGSITPNVYWYKGGSFTLLPYELSQKQIVFTPPEEFTVLLNALAGNEDETNG